MIIGITGGSGCGKSTLLQVIADLGGKVLDCDTIYHDLLKTDKTLLCAIENRFPGTVVSGHLQRRALGQIVFADEKALKDLNKITHTAVKEEVLKQLSPAPELAAIDAIGLFESGLNELCDITVTVTAPLEQRVHRLMKRDNITREYALARIQAQPTEEAFISRCDAVLCNSETESAFREKSLVFLKNKGIMIENPQIRRNIL